MKNTGGCKPDIKRSTQVILKALSSEVDSKQRGLFGK
jgi:hypothetical protein